MPATGNGRQEGDHVTVVEFGAAMVLLLVEHHDARLVAYAQLLSKPVDGGASGTSTVPRLPCQSAGLNRAKSPKKTTVTFMVIGW